MSVFNEVKRMRHEDQGRTFSSTREPVLVFSLTMAKQNFMFSLPFATEPSTET
jgi:hypothetical protein